MPFDPHTYAEVIAAARSELAPPAPALPCICHGNWRLLVAECAALLNRTYVDSKGVEYTFIGLVHGADDYYYGMLNKTGHLSQLSCVGTPDGFGFTLKDQTPHPVVSTPASALPCVCQGNWRLLVAEYDALLNCAYVDSRGVEYTFIGLIHGAEDYYGMMLTTTGQVHLLSCVGTPEGFGFTLKDPTPAPR